MPERGRLERFISTCRRPLDANRDPAGNPAVRSVSQCRGGLTVNPDFDPNFLAFDLTRRGSPFAYSQTGTIKQQAVYLQDNIKAGDATFNVGLRVDHATNRAVLVQPGAADGTGCGDTREAWRPSIA